MASAVVPLRDPTLPMKAVLLLGIKLALGSAHLAGSQERGPTSGQDATEGLSAADSSARNMSVFFKTDEKVARLSKHNSSQEMEVSQEAMVTTSVQSRIEKQQLKEQLSKLTAQQGEAEQAYQESLSGVRQSIAASYATEDTLLNVSQKKLAVEAELLDIDSSIPLGLGSIVILVVMALCCLVYFSIGMALWYFMLRDRDAALNLQDLIGFGAEPSETWSGYLGFGISSLGISSDTTSDLTPQKELLQDYDADVPIPVPEVEGLLEKMMQRAKEIEGPDSVWKKMDEDKKRRLMLLVTREARYMLLLTLIPVVFLPATTCEDGMPIVAYALYAPLFVRSRYVEWSILKLFNVTFDALLVLRIVLDGLEHFDWFTDGGFLGQAYACDATVTPIYAATFSKTPLFAVSGVVTFLHFGGIAVIVFLIAAFAQQCLALPCDPRNGGGITGVPMSADAAGMGAVADVLEQVADSRGIPLSPKALMSALVKAFLENILQLNLQVAFFCITFEVTGTAAKVKQIMSISIALVNCSCKFVAEAFSLARIMISDTHGLSYRVLSGFIAMYILGLVAAIVLSIRLYMAFRCPSHMWNVTGGFWTDGCVDMKDLL
eukprot:TRINITY_DN9352_c0_g1_i1.p1 TRINITY_DN9352_c0_g1~~TRINITY_DN9352_c0_g1_i1.p1  ORF type:complete len:604 (+),score=85.76 TRINITY_DN9352_c0_g1_i1:43-1854(+)